MLPIGSIGDIVFMVNPIRTLTFRDMTTTASAVFADHQVVGTKQVSEFLGPNLKMSMLSIDLSVTLGVVPQNELDKLVEILEKGEPQLLVIGPVNHGKITLRSIDSRPIYFNGLGTPTHIECDIQYAEYIDALPSQAKTKQNQDKTQRSTTGKGGPERLPGSSSATKSRSLNPLPKDVKIDPVTRMPIK